MAKICKNCGVKHKNSATYCVMCGEPFYSEQGLKKRKIHRIIGIVLGVLALTAGVLFIFTAGPKAAVRRILNGYKRNDPDAVIASYPDFLIESNQVDKDQLILSTQINVKDMSDYIFMYKLGKSEDPSEKEYEELMEAFRFYAGEDFSEDDIQSIKIIWVDYTGNVPAVWPSRAARFIVIKYEGRWYWWPETVNR
ncbi:MAG: hypothetical protein J6S71_06325 [Clostridia bacterium]|nr:hypothetical protein [Clostridia bacterium]